MVWSTCPSHPQQQGEYGTINLFLHHFIFPIIERKKRSFVAESVDAPIFSSLILLLQRIQDDYSISEMN